MLVVGKLSFFVCCIAIILIAVVAALLSFSPAAAVSSSLLALSLSFSRFHFYCQEYFTLYTLKIYNTHNTTTTGIAIIISYYCSRSSGKRSIWECEWMWSRIMSSHKRTLSFSPFLSLRVSEAPYPHIIHIYRKEKKKGEKKRTALLLQQHIVHYYWWWKERERETSHDFICSRHTGRRSKNIHNTIFTFYYCCFYLLYYGGWRRQWRRRRRLREEAEENDVRDDDDVERRKEAEEKKRKMVACQEKIHTFHYSR